MVVKELIFDHFSFGGCERCLSPLGGVMVCERSHF